MSNTTTFEYERLTKELGFTHDEATKTIANRRDQDQRIKEEIMNDQVNTDKPTTEKKDLTIYARARRMIKECNNDYLQAACEADHWMKSWRENRLMQDYWSKVEDCILDLHSIEVDKANSDLCQTTPAQGESNV